MKTCWGGVGDISEGILVEGFLNPHSLVYVFFPLFDDIYSGNLLGTFRVVWGVEGFE